MRIEIYVHPGARRTDVGGVHADALVVRVREPAHAGSATRAALRTLAEVLAVPPSHVRLVHGATSRRKLVEIDVAPSAASECAATLARLRAIR